MRARAAQRSPPSASARKEVTLRAPDGSVHVQFVHGQADVERALGNLGCKGALLRDEASQKGCSRFPDLQDGGSYTVLPQPAPGQVRRG